jgi:integrase/recombinase XerD
VVADDRLVGGAWGDAGGRARRRAGLAQGAAARFRVPAVTAGIPLNLVQKWLGHAQLSTTAVYANAVGTEEKEIARRMWS